MESLQPVVQDFETAWRGVRPPRIEDFLPADSGKRRQLLVPIIRIDLEQRLMKGQPARLEHYLEQYPDLASLPRDVVTLLAAEYTQRRRREPRLTLEEYRTRFPAYHAPLVRRLLNAPENPSSQRPAPAGDEPTEPGWGTGLLVEPEQNTVAQPPGSPLELLQQLDKTILLDAVKRDELARLREQFARPRELADHLVGRGWLTSFQADRLLEGRGDDIFIGPFQLLEPLGQGGMGQVFKARRQPEGTIVAVKRVPSELLRDVQTVRRFQREIRFLSRLSHPNIVQALGAGQVEGLHYLVMEFIDGVDLGKLVKTSGRLPVAETCSYLAQAAMGLEYAHSSGLVHRDIKPSNLILQASRDNTGRDKDNTSRDREGAVVKVLDLGLASWRREHLAGQSTTLTMEGAVIGTPDYISPEQTMNAHGVDCRADLYSLGCTMYHLLSGQVPFPVANITEKLVMHQTCEPLPLDKLRPDVPPVLAEVVRRLLAKNPADRFQTAKELGDMLNCVAELATKKMAVG